MHKAESHFISGDSEKLWTHFLQGDKVSFEKIYRLHIKDLLNYGYKVTADRKLIEDSVQDLFYELWQSRENLSPTTSIKFYLFRAIRYKIIRNGKDRRLDLRDSLSDAEMYGDEASQEHALIEIETHEQQQSYLKEGISKLPKRQQEAINLRYYHNFSNEEIAEIMEVNYQSACKFLYTGLKNLRLQLKPSALLFISGLLSYFFSE
jgi:RNA polymerase sigma factor (sigma-70 family)